MRNFTWLRYAMASVVALGAGTGALVACGDDDTGTVPKADSGTPDTSTPDTGTPDTGPRDSGTDATAPLNAKLTLVNASVSLGPNGDVGSGKNLIRVCFARGRDNTVSDGVAPYPPLPHKPAGGLPLPGIPNGTGGAFPSLGVDLEPLFIQPIVMNARTLAGKGIIGSGVGTSCDEILKPGFVGDGGATFTENVDFWKLPVIPGNTFKKDKSFLLVLSGCSGDVVDATNCGPNAPAGGGAPGVGNLKVDVFELDRATAVAADSVGAQFFHASSPFTVNPGAALPVVPAFRDSPDGGASPLSGGTAVDYLKGTQLVQVKGLKPVITPNPNADQLSFPLSAVQQLSAQPAPYALGKAYTFILVGDTQVPVQEADGGINTNGYHFLGFPNDPPVVQFTP